MRYIMRQKFWSFGNDYTIQDEAGNDRFFVDGKPFSIGDKLSFQDMAGNELVYVQQRVLSWGPTYELHRAGGAPTIVKKHWTFVQDRFTVDIGADGPTPDDMEIQGDFWEHEYSITRNSQPVALISKRWFSLADAYGVQTAPSEDDVLLLACTVIVDLCIAKQKND